MIPSPWSRQHRQTAVNWQKEERMPTSGLLRSQIWLGALLPTCTSCHVEGNFQDPRSTCAYSVIVGCRSVSNSTLGA